MYAREKKICNFENDDCKIIGKIGKIYNEMIQKEFFLVKILRNQVSKNL